MEELNMEEMLLLYWFGCPDVRQTKARLWSVARLAAGNSLRERICILYSKLTGKGVAEYYPAIYFSICDMLSPDHGTRPPEAGALKVPENDGYLAA